MVDYDDWDDELSRPDSYPLSISLIGCLIIVALGVFVQPRLGYPPLGIPVLGGIAIAAVLWVIGFAITIRHANFNWKMSSFGILIAAALITSVAGVVVANLKLREDARTLAEMRVGPDGLPEFTPGAEERGPISRLFIGFFKGVADDQRALNAATIKSGLNLMGDPDQLKRYPVILRDCGSIDRIKTLATATLDRQIQRQRDLLRQIDATNLPASFKKEMREELEKGKSAEGIKAIGKAQSTLFDESRELCTILARRHWESQFGRFAFTNGADLTQFQDHSEKRNTAASDIQRLRLEGLARSRERQSQLRQNLFF